MRSFAGITVALVVMAALACSEGPTPAAPEPSAALEPARDPAAIERGRQIFVTGKSPSGATIQAVLAGDVIVDASNLPCVGCHGEDGQGRPEGGMTPSNITWERLSKPYGGRSEAGREHQGYDAKALRKAIAMGIDPSGNPLLPTMPRHRMSRADMDSLVAYLATLGELHAIGIDEQAITLTTVQLDTSSPAIRAVLRGFFAEVNARGGVFGRRLELEIIELDAKLGVDAQIAALSSAWSARPGFAVIAPQLGHAEPELLRWLADAGVPVIGPVTRYPTPGTPPMRSVFFLDGGIPAQAHALAQFALAGSEPLRDPSQPVAADARRRGVVVFADREPERALGLDLLVGWQQAGVDAQTLAVGELESGPELAARLVALDPEFVVWLGPAELGLAALSALAGAKPGAEPPRILLPGSVTIGDLFSLPAPLSGRVFAAYPWLPDDVAPATMRDFQALAETHGLPTTERPTQLASLTSATILLEGLTRAGRAVTRESLIGELERLREFRTGLTPEITYGPNQHVGLHDPRIVSFDLDNARLTRVE